MQNRSIVEQQDIAALPLERNTQLIHDARTREHITTIKRASVTVGDRSIGRIARVSPAVENSHDRIKPRHLVRLGIEFHCWQNRRDYFERVIR